MPERFECEVAAGLLDSGQVTAQASHVMAILGGLTVLHGNVWGARAIALGSLLLWACQCWFAARVTLDARLFHLLSANPAAAMPQLDELLARWKLASAAREVRPLASRTRGALRLWRGQIGCLSLQTLLVMTALSLEVISS